MASVQRRQVPAAGDQHQAGACAGQQRQHLLAAGRVIQHQQQLPPGQPVPPQRHPRRQPRRDLPGRDPCGQQQAGQRILGIHRLLARGVPVQRQEDLPAGEPVRQPVRRVHRERGLAHPGHPADRMDAHHPARPRRGLRQLLQLPLPPGERGDVTRQRPRRRRHTARRHAAPRGRLEPGPGRADQAQRIGQQPHRVLLRAGHRPPLQVADRAHAQRRRLSQFLLRQPGLPAQLPQQAGERDRRLSHSPHLPALAANSSILPPSALTPPPSGQDGPARMPASTPSATRI